MKFFPFAFTGNTITSDLYYDVDIFESYSPGSTTWYNIGKTNTKVSYTNLNVSSSWYGTDSTGSYIAAPSGVDIKFNGGLGSQPTVSTYIYKIKLNTSVDGERFLGRDGITINKYWASVTTGVEPPAGLFGATQTFSQYASTLSVTPTMKNQYFYIAIVNSYTGPGYGSTDYFTSLDNFTTQYNVLFSPGSGIAFALDYLDFIITGMGKLKTIGAYVGRALTSQQMRVYAQDGPFV